MNRCIVKLQNPKLRDSNAGSPRMESVRTAISAVSTQPPPKPPIGVVDGSLFSLFTTLIGRSSNLLVSPRSWLPGLLSRNLGTTRCDKDQGDSCANGGA